MATKPKKVAAKAASPVKKPAARPIGEVAKDLASLLQDVGIVHTPHAVARAKLLAELASIL